MIKGLRGKIWISIIFLITVILALSWVLQVFLLEKIYFNQRVSEIMQEGNELSNYFVQRDSAKIQQKLSELSNTFKGRITIIDGNGNAAFINSHLGFRRDLSISAEQLRKIFRGDKIVYKSVNSLVETSTLVLGMPVSDGSNVIGALVFNVPIENIEGTIGVIRTQFFYIVIGAILLSIIFALGISKFLTRPLVKIKKVASAMAGGDFTPRVDNLSEDEIGQLGHTLNFMAASLDSTLSNLNKNNQKLNNILSSIGDGVIALDIEGKIIHVNVNAVQYQDIPKVGDFLEKGHFLFTLIEEVKEKNTGVYKEQSQADKILAYKVTPYHQNEEVEGVVIVISDITRERNFERLRTELVANVSHELRTPISLIQGYSEALRDGVAKDINKEDEFIDVIYSESGRLAKLVEDILDMSAMESGGFKIEKEIFDIVSLINRITQKTRVLAEKNQINVIINRSIDFCLVIGDEKRIEQVVVNLISNAINSTPAKGQVIIDIKPKTQNVEIEVKDNGVGISKEDLPYIWDRFYRVDKSRNRQMGGTGLGLAIVKNILESHQSTYGVYSELNIGTKFFFTLEREL